MLMFVNVNVNLLLMPLWSHQMSGMVLLMSGQSASSQQLWLTRKSWSTDWNETDHKLKSTLTVDYPWMNTQCLRFKRTNAFLSLVTIVLKLQSGLRISKMRPFEQNMSNIQTHALVPLHFIWWIEAKYKPSTHHQELRYLKFDLTNYVQEKNC